MNETDTSAVVPGEADFDDVEAHGIKEVMVGLSAAAVLTGGVAAVLADEGARGSTGRASISADAPGTDISGADLAAAGTDVAGADAVAPRAASTTTDRASVLGTRMSADTAVDEADDDVKAPSFLGSQLDRSDAALDSTVSWTRDVRDNTVGTTRATVREAQTTVRSAPGTAIDAVEDVRDVTVKIPSVSEVRNDVRETTTSVSRAAESTIVLTGDLVRGVEGTATTTIARVQPAVGSSIDAETATGWVTVSVGGEEIARAEVRDGQATLSYTAPRADAPITFAFTGTDTLAASAVTL
ncbi:MAG TPA: hypothetical protein VNA12_08845 [Mycobacteriales bacterium]|nr:hypothetical protein [Mycobacteriales bacterium]